MSTKTLEDLCELIVDCKNRTPPEAPKGDGIAYAIGTPHIIDGRIQLQDAKPVTQETFDIWTARAVPRENDIILTREAPVGRVGRVESNMKICLGQRTMLLRSDPKRADPRFLHYFLLSSEIQGILHAYASGSTVPHLRVSQVRELPIPKVPPLADQRMIGDLLGTLDDKISVNENIATTALVLAESFFYALNAESSRDVLVGDILELKYGKSLPSTQRREGNVPVYGSGGIGGSHDEALAKGPGIIVGRKGTVGSVHWSQEDFFPIDTTFFIAIKDAELSMEYSYFAIKSLGLKDMNSDSAVPGLNRSNVLALRLQMAKPKCISKFTQQVQPLFMLRARMSAENTALVALRDTLLPQLMSGRLRVRDAERIVEDAL